MGHKHTKEEILAAALQTAFVHGLSRLTYGRVAKSLGIADRTVVYYFPTKEDLVAAVLVSMGIELQRTLGPTLASPASDHLELAKKAWPVLARPESDPVFALFFEANGLAASGQEPYGALVPQLVDAWIGWTAEFIQGQPADSRAEAEAAVALLDGLLLLRQMAGSRAANRGARRLGLID